MLRISLILGAIAALADVAGGFVLVRAKGVEPGTSKFHKVKEELIAQKLNARPKKVVPEEIVEGAQPVGPPPPPGTYPKKMLRQPIVRT